MYETTVILSVFLASWSLLYAVSEAQRLIDERSERQSEMRRERLRAKHYADMNKRWTVKQNRAQLWEAVKK